jgi:hypothetical protein
LLVLQHLEHFLCVPYGSRHARFFVSLRPPPVRPRGGFASGRLSGSSGCPHETPDFDLDRRLRFRQIGFVFGHQIEIDVSLYRVPAELPASLRPHNEAVRLNLANAKFSDVILNVGLAVVRMPRIGEVLAATGFEVLNPREFVPFYEIGVQTKSMDLKIV